ncbi:MAG TPA: SIMPL domain-containing protein [Actinomycetota bacterium]|nr:SIMPL domain-containing protein [Actinomycetota bacterium]
MKGNAKWGSAGLALGVTVALMLPSLAQSSDPEPGAMERTVTVSGTAAITSDPDEAVVTLGVQTQAQTAEAAMRDNANRMNEVIQAVRREGVAADDVATAWINLYPRYDDNGNAIVGYTAENQVNVTVRAMDDIGTVIDAAIEGGANLSSGIAFGLSDESAGAEDALAEAVADARSKAEALAAASGAQLGAVVSVVESGAPSPPVMYRDYAVAEAATVAGAPPVETPTIETEVGVTVTWELR